MFWSNKKIVVKHLGSSLYCQFNSYFDHFSDNFIFLSFIALFCKGTNPWIVILLLILIHIHVSNWTFKIVFDTSNKMWILKKLHFNHLCIYAQQYKQSLLFLFHVVGSPSFRFKMFNTCLRFSNLSIGILILHVTYSFFPISGLHWSS